jgi:hypothetical protein
VRDSPRGEDSTQERLAEAAGTYDALCVTIPAFAVAVLRQRAIDAGEDVSEVLTRLVLDDIMVDEVQEMAARNPGLGESFAGWFRGATGRR